MFDVVRCTRNWTGEALPLRHFFLFFFWAQSNPRTHPTHFLLSKKMDAVAETMDTTVPEETLIEVPNVTLVFIGKPEEAAGRVGKLVLTSKCVELLFLCLFSI